MIKVVFDCKYEDGSICPHTIMMSCVPRKNEIIFLTLQNERIMGKVKSVYYTLLSGPVVGLDEVDVEVKVIETRTI